MPSCFIIIDLINKDEFNEKQALQIARFSKEEGKILFWMPVRLFLHLDRKFRFS